MAVSRETHMITVQYDPAGTATRVTIKSRLKNPNPDNVDMDILMDETVAKAYTDLTRAQQAACDDLPSDMGTPVVDADRPLVKT